VILKTTTGSKKVERKPAAGAKSTRERRLAI
jgi:hypothetical protein